MVEEHKDRFRQTVKQSAEPSAAFVITPVCTSTSRSPTAHPGGSGDERLLLPPTPTTSPTTRAAGSFNCQALTFVEQQ